MERTARRWTSSPNGPSGRSGSSRSRSRDGPAQEGPRVSPPGHYLNRRKSERSPDGLLDLLIQHYDELSRFVALADARGDGPENRRQVGEFSVPRSATPSRS